MITSNRNNGHGHVQPAVGKLETGGPTGSPTFTLRSGDKMPSIGMGTFTGTRLTQRAEKTGPGGVMEKNIVTWIKAGGRMIDAAQNYLNEAEIGDAIEQCINEGYCFFYFTFLKLFCVVVVKFTLLQCNQYVLMFNSHCTRTNIIK